MTEHANELILAFGFVFTALISVLAWIGNRVHTRLDKLTDTVDNRFGDLQTVLGNIERDLRGDLVNLDRRLTMIETRCSYEHDKP